MFCFCCCLGGFSLAFCLLVFVVEGNCVDFAVLFSGFFYSSFLLSLLIYFML